MEIYVVTAGDTLNSISQEFGVPVSNLVINNGIRSDGQLAVGQSIAIVKPLITHTVREGESLYSIAAKYGVTVNSLYKNNLILKGSDLTHTGQELIIKIERDPIGDYVIGGYAYPFIETPLLNTTLPFMDNLIPFTYGFRRDGSLIELNDVEMLERAAYYKTVSYLHLSSLDENDVFSLENAEYLLHNRQLWDVILNNVLEMMNAKGYKGLDIDFEFLGKTNAVIYADFVRFMRENLNKEGYPVIVALAPKTSDEQGGDLYEGHDYRLLGEAANYVLIMTYEWGYTFGPPMAISPAPSVRRVLDYAVSRIDSRKIYLGISNYGYDFTLPFVAGESQAPSVSTVEAVNLAVENGSEIHFDAAVLAPFFNYIAGDSRVHEVWFEDARSIRERLLMMREYNLKGGLYWNLNRENPQNLTVLNTMID